MIEYLKHVVRGIISLLLLIGAIAVEGIWFGIPNTFEIVAMKTLLIVGGGFAILTTYFHIEHWFVEKFGGKNENKTSEG